GEPEALVQLPFAVTAGGAEPRGVHHQDPPVRPGGEALDHDRVARRRPPGPHGGDQGTSRADLDRQLSPAKRLRCARLVVLTVLEGIAGRGVPEVVVLGLFYEGGPAWPVAAGRELLDGHAGAGRDAAPLHAQHLLRLAALAGLLR